MARRERLAVIEVLDRLGLLKYVLAASITLLAFGVTAGALDRKSTRLNSSH